MFLSIHRKSFDIWSLYKTCKSLPCWLMRLFQVAFGSLVFGMWRGNRYLWFGVRFLTRQTYGCIYGLLGACAEVPTEGGRTCSILCFDLHIPPLLIIVNLNRHYDNCNTVNLFIVLVASANLASVLDVLLFWAWNWHRLFLLLPSSECEFSAQRVSPVEAGEAQGLKGSFWPPE